MSNHIKFAIVLISAVLLCCLVLFYFSPHLAVYSMRSAANKGDHESFSGYIDYPALRADIKQKVSLNLAKDVEKELAGNPFASAASAMLEAMVSNFVDSFVRPEKLSEFIKAKNPAKANVNNSELSYSYESYNVFNVSLKDDNKTVELVFNRHGLFGWKLSGINF